MKRPEARRAAFGTHRCTWLLAVLAAVGLARCTCGEATEEPAEVPSPPGPTFLGVAREGVLGRPAGADLAAVGGRPFEAVVALRNAEVAWAEATLQVGGETRALGPLSAGELVVVPFMVTDPPAAGEEKRIPLRVVTRGAAVLGPDGAALVEPYKLAALPGEVVVTVSESFPEDQILALVLAKPGHVSQSYAGAPEGEARFLVADLPPGVYRTAVLLLCGTLGLVRSARTQVRAHRGRTPAEGR